MSIVVAELYPWIKAFHIMAVIAWLAGILYLPRLFVYHLERAQPGTEVDEMFQTMERRLYRKIMNPAMAAAWLLGISLALIPGVVDFGGVWPWTKLAGLVGLSWFHIWCGEQMRNIAAGRNIYTGKAMRIANEVPVLFVFVVVISVVVGGHWN